MQEEPYVTVCGRHIWTYSLQSIPTTETQGRREGGMRGLCTVSRGQGVRVRSGSHGMRHALRPCAGE